MILNEYNAISDLKKGLKIKTYFSPFYEIYFNLDNMIMKDHLLQKEQLLDFSFSDNFMVPDFKFLQMKSIYWVIKNQVLFNDLSDYHFKFSAHLSHHRLYFFTHDTR